VILGTGGTIAGTAAAVTDAVGYTAAQLSVQHLVAAVPALAAARPRMRAGGPARQKDMDHATWQRLAQRAGHHLSRSDVAGVVVTHGTDTLEETAYLLQVLTAAMRPATAIGADGPRNLLDAVRLAQDPQASGVLLALAGRAWAGAEVRKTHTWRLDAFDAGDAGALADLLDGAVQWWRTPPRATPLGLAVLARDAARWPRVAIVHSHAGADGMVVDALRAHGVDGLVIAGTGNATMHRDLAAAVERAMADGIDVLRCSRCAAGPVQGGPDLPEGVSLTPAQARVELLLRLLATGP
jgi:L-asparaginase